MDRQFATTIVPRMNATIWLGTYSDRGFGMNALFSEPGQVVERVCREYCDEIGLCVTVAPTTFHYTGGGEPGFAIGLINYARFPSTLGEIRSKAIELAKRLQAEFRQKRVTVEVGDESIMIEQP